MMTILACYILFNAAVFVAFSGRAARRAACEGGEWR